MSGLTHDLRYAVRTLAGRPGFTLVIVTTLALGIGAVVAVVDLINLLAWQRPPVERPEEVVEVYTKSSQPIFGATGLTPFPDFEVYRDSVTAFDGLAAFVTSSANLDHGDATRPVNVWAVTGNLFEVLGVRAAAGRMLESADGEPGRPPVAVVSYDLWRRLGEDPALLGSTVRLAGVPLTVVGVAERGFIGTQAGSRIDLFFPHWLAPRVLDPAMPWLDDREWPRWSLLGRLGPDSDHRAAAAELQARATVLDQEDPVEGLERRTSVVAAGYAHPIDRRGFRPTLRLFGAAVGLLLIIVCANVGHLLLARAMARRREMGIRQSLGAGRRRLVRQLLTESLVLAFLGGLGGVFLALQARTMIENMVDSDFAAALSFDHRVMGMTLLVVLGSTFLFGLGPALVTSRVDLVGALKDGGAAGAGGKRRRVTAGPLLASAQVALSLVLLISTGVLVKSLWEYRQADLGFDSENLLLTWIDTAPARYEREAGQAFFRQLEERAGALPGVSSAGIGLLPPPLFIDVGIRFHLPEDPETVHSSRLDYANAAYLETLGLPLLAGRLFDDRPRAANEIGEESRGTVVISSVLAENLWPGESAVGRVIRLEQPRRGEPRDYEIIGVVGSTVQYRLAREKEPLVYFSWAERHRPRLALAMRAVGEPESVFAALRDELRALDPGLTLEMERTHASHRWDGLVEQRLHVQTLGIFGLSGFLLALLGIFGVMSHGVNRQVREIGLRMALGARRLDILRFVLWRGAVLTTAGIALGLLGSVWAMGLLRAWVAGWMAETGNLDPVIFAGAALLLLAASLFAVWLPARRAAAIEPLEALRWE